MPIPHPYGFYDRKKKAFSTTHTSYIDNLALADGYLAHIRQLLEQKHEVGPSPADRCDGRSLVAHDPDMEGLHDLD